MDGSRNDDTLSATEEGVPIGTLFIGNIAQRTTDRDLHRVFSKYGKIDGCYLKTSTRRSNYAFVTFSNVADATKARKDGIRKAINLHNRDLRVMSADSWHQPDTIKNRKKLITKKNRKINDEQLSDDYMTDDAPIYRLNSDCLIQVFQYLPIVDRVRIERVCKRWRILSQESWRTAKRLDFRESTWGFTRIIEQQEVDTGTLRKVSLQCSHLLKQIDSSQIIYSQLLRRSLTIVGKFCPNLQALDVTGVSVDASGIDSLTNNCQGIVKPSLGSCISYCDNDLQKSFAENKKLKCFNLSHNYHITGECLIQLPSDTIEEITIINCNGILPCHFSTAIVKFEKLSSLSLGACDSLNDSAIEAICTRVNSLKILELSGFFPRITTSAMLHIASLVNLEKLNVSLNPAVNDEFLNVLVKQCKQLIAVDVCGCKGVSEEGLSRIASLPKLDKLIMSYLYVITDEALAHIQNLRSLLYRGYRLLTDDGAVAIIQSSPRLELFDLSRCEHISNNLLEVIVKATKMQTDSTVMKILVGETAIIENELTVISPLLKIVLYGLNDENSVSSSEDSDSDSEYDDF